MSSTPRPHFTPGKDTVSILQGAGWTLGPVWKGGKSRSHQDSIPDRPARSSFAIPTELPGPLLRSVLHRNSNYVDPTTTRRRLDDDSTTTRRRLDDDTTTAWRRRDDDTTTMMIIKIVIMMIITCRSARLLSGKVKLVNYAWESFLSSRK